MSDLPSQRQLLLRSIPAALLGSLAGSLALVPFGVTYFGVSRSSVYSDFLIMLYAVPIMLALFVVPGIPVLLVCHRLGRVSAMGIALGGAMFGAALALYADLSNAMAGMLICAGAGAIAASVWLKVALGSESLTL